MPRSRSDHDAFAGRDAYLTLAAGDHRSGGGPAPGWLVDRRPRPFSWTPAAIVRLVVVVLASAAVLVAAVVQASGRYTTDTATSRGTANAYFAALQRGDDLTAARLTCEDPLFGHPRGPDTVRRALAGGSPRPPEWELGPGHGDEDEVDAIVLYDFLIPREVRGTISVERNPGEEWRVCQFLDLEVWVESS